MKPIVAELWGQQILIIAISGSLVTYVTDSGRIETADLWAEGVEVRVTAPNTDFPIGYQFYATRVEA